MPTFHFARVRCWAALSARLDEVGEISSTHVLDVKISSFSSLHLLSSLDCPILVLMIFSRAQLFLLLPLARLSSCALAAPFTPRAVIVNGSQLRAEYDYVVIGGGTSGLVVANRLTENPNGGNVQRQIALEFED